MLDPDEVAAYEAWKMNKIAGVYDLTITSFNAEMTALAGAWDDGVRVSINPVDHQALTSILSRNPYRQPGMTAYNSSISPVQKEIE